MSEMGIVPEEADRLYERLKSEAEASGYHLNPDVQFTKTLVKGLVVNQDRYGYRSCPCRLAAGDKGDDLDIICPCDYRDPDLAEYGACYCALYVSQAVVDGARRVTSIPERRRPPEKRRKPSSSEAVTFGALSQPVWRCRVCGYLCAREQPPEVCPICKAERERFERFMGPGLPGNREDANQ